MPHSWTFPNQSDAPRCGQNSSISPYSPTLLRNAISRSERIFTRTGGPSFSGSSSLRSAGIQYCRKRSPAAVPGPVCVRSSLVSCFSMQWCPVDPPLAKWSYLLPLSTLTRKQSVEARVDATRVQLEHLAPVVIGDVERVDVALRVVPVKARLGIDALDGAEQLGREQDVVGVDHPREQVDPRLVVDARVEEDVPHHVAVERRAPEAVGEPAVA